MSSTVTRTSESAQRRIPGEGVVVVPSNAQQTDETPTVISKSPLVLPPPSNSNKPSDVLRKTSTPESIVAGIRGRKLAHFELIDPIGVGGMAAVIRARDTQLDRIVALKILPPEASIEQENVQRFHQEAKAAAKLDHENIARVFFCGEDQGLHFIAFEYVEGINLRAMLEKRGRVPIAEAVRYILQVAAGLEHASSRGVVHRDVKPSNIIITPDGRAKLVDMGLARSMDRHGERDLTQSGMTLGTFDYISPEQALEPREADARSDIYSLGCTFYHLLTGIPPVPEGTPAKKLHHHQHIAPLDPRQIDPSIPDEIVMILGKMMDKNPDRRYQRPVHLVQHLMQIARDVGAADDLAENVLFVDAPLPRPPVARPLLLVGMAITALVVVTLLLSLAPQPDFNPRPGGSNTGNGNVKAGVPKTELPKKDIKPTIPTAIAQPGKIKTTEDFVQALADHVSHRVDVEIEAARAIELGHFTLSAGDQRFEFGSKDAEANLLKFQATSTDTKDGLTIESGEKVVFKKLTFHLEAEKSLALGQILAAVAIRSPKVVEFEECVFTQKVPAMSKQAPLASIHIDAGDRNKPEVTFNSCLFDYSVNQEGGQVAVAINGSATVRFDNCAFKSCGAMVYLRSGATKANTHVIMRNCAGFVGNAPVFRFEKDAVARISVNQSVFSRPTDAIGLPGLPQPGLVFLDTDSQIHFVGQQNIYHNLMAYVEPRSANLITEPEEFGRFINRATPPGFDHASSHLKKTASPWHQKEPLTVNGYLAFQLKPDLHELEVGLRKAWTGQSIPRPTPAAVVANDLAKMKIVDPETPGHFENLAQALAGARDDDVIYIKAGENREVIVPPITLDPKITVTLRPFEDHKPILVMKKGFKDKDSAMFKVQDGTLKVVGMEITLDPSSDGFESQSFVHLGETATCQFANCVFNLRATSEVKLNVVTFVDLATMMKMGIRNNSGAGVRFDECLVRGRGDLILLRGCRKLFVDIKNSFFALDGSLLDIESSNKQMPMDEGVSWKMSKSSVFVTESLFSLRSKAAGKGLSETHADIENCLLASIAADQPIVNLDTERPSTLEKFLKWRGEKNYFANFDAGSVNEWKTFEPALESGMLTFPRFNDDLIKTLADATPEWFAHSEPITGFGIPPLSSSKLLTPNSKSD